MHLSLSWLTFIFVPISFRALRRDGFSSESSSAAPVNSINSGEAAGKPDYPTSGVILTRSKGTLQDLFSIYPKAAPKFRSSIRAANLDKGIKGADFQFKKERMLILHYLLENYEGLSTNQTRSLGDAVLVSRDKQKTLELLKSFAMEEKRVFHSAPWGNKMPVISKEEAMWRAANNYAMSISDSRFLSFMKAIPVSGFLHDAALECEKTAYGCLTTQLDSLVSETSRQIVSMQKEECDKQVPRELKSEEERELKVSRTEFVQQIEDLSREHRSYVAYSSGDV